MALNARQKRVLGRDLRDAVLRLCAAAGGFLALLWDVHHKVGQPAHAANDACGEHAPGRAAAGSVVHCVGSELSTVILAWLIPVAVGLLVGSLVGLALASVIRLGRSPASRQARRSSRR